MPDATVGVPREPTRTSKRARAEDAPPGLDPVAEPAPRGRAIDDALFFSRTRNLLAGLMGCTSDCAGRALAGAAVHFGLSQRRIAENVLELMQSAEGLRDPLMVMLAVATASRVDRVRAFESLWDEHGAMCYTLAFAIVGEQRLAEDVTRSVFLAWWRIGEPFGDSAVEGLRLLRSTRREAIVTARKERTTASRPNRVRWTIGSDRPVEAGAHQMRFDPATTADLSHRQQEVLRLAYFGAYTQRHIAQITGASVDEVKATLLAAVRKLAELRRLRADSPSPRDSDWTAPAGDPADDPLSPVT